MLSFWYQSVNFAAEKDLVGVDEGQGFRHGDEYLALDRWRAPPLQRERV